MRTAVAVAVLTMLAPAASAQTGPTPRPTGRVPRLLAGEVRAEIQAYCWRETGAGSGICADDFRPIDPPQALVVDRGELVTLRFDRPLRPNSISVSRRETSVSAPLETFNVAPDNPTRFRVNFPPGTHIVTMFTLWPQGDAAYVFEVTVRPMRDLSALFREALCPGVQSLHVSSPRPGHRGRPDVTIATVRVPCSDDRGQETAEDGRAVERSHDARLLRPPSTAAPVCSRFRSALPPRSPRRRSARQERASAR